MQKVSTLLWDQFWFHFCFQFEWATKPFLCPISDTYYRFLHSNLNQSQTFCILLDRKENQSQKILSLVWPARNYEIVSRQHRKEERSNTSTCKCVRCQTWQTGHFCNRSAQCVQPIVMEKWLSAPESVISYLWSPNEISSFLRLFLPFFCCFRHR